MAAVQREKKEIVVIAGVAQNRDSTTLFAIAACFAVVMGIIYLPLFVGPAEFIADDEYYIVRNAVVRQPSFIDALHDIWSQPLRIEYFPVTVTSFAVDYALWGLQPKMFRLTNVLLFCLIGMVAYSLAWRLQGDRGAGGFFSRDVAAALSVALLLMHPANVESVASVANRKELLYVLFGLLSIRSYLTNGDSWQGGAATILFLTAAQLSKGTAVVLPIIFIAYELASRRDWSGLRHRVPLLLTAAGVAGAIFSYQFAVAIRSGMVVEQAQHLAIGGRIAGVLTTLNRMGKTLFFPSNQTMEYDILFPASLPGAPWVLPLSLTVILVWLLWRRRYQSLFLVLLLLIPLLPYLNIIRLKHGVPGRLVNYDHYLLFTTMAAAPLLTGVLCSVQRTWRYAAAIMLSCVMVWYVAESHELAGYWKTRETLFSRAIAMSPNIPRPYFYLGQAYVDAGRYGEAITALEKGLAFKQGVPDPVFYQVFGDAYAFSEKYAEAERYYTVHLRVQPEDTKSLQNLSLSLMMQNKDREARALIRRWLAVSPEDPDALKIRSVLDEKGRRRGQR